MIREEAIKVLANFYVSTKNSKANHLCEAVYFAIQALKNEPKHGHWIVISEYPKKAECSYCGYPIEHELVCWWDYCPNCSARMDEVEE